MCWRRTTVRWLFPAVTSTVITWGDKTPGQSRGGGGARAGRHRFRALSAPRCPVDGISMSDEEDPGLRREGQQGKNQLTPFPGFPCVFEKEEITHSSDF